MTPIYLHPEFRARAKRKAHAARSYSGDLADVTRDVLADFLSQDARHTLSHVLGRAATRADKAGFTETAREFRDLARLVVGLGV